MIRITICLLTIAALALGGCDSTEPEECAPADPLRPDRFRPCETGSGAFGRWRVDPFGLPAYDYSLDQRTDPRAVWITSDGSERRDHWFQIGNRQLTGLVTNDGLSQVFSRRRGPVLLDRIDLAAGRPGGGFSYIREADGRVWASAWGLKPADALAARRYGIGYAQFETVHEGLRVVHRVLAPPGDHAFLVDRIELVNESGHRRSFEHVAFWDVNRHPLELQLTRSGSLSPELPAQQDAAREAINALFDLSAVADPDLPAVRVRHTYAGDDAVGPDEPADRDVHPDDIFLARLWPPTADLPVDWHTDRAGFFGRGRVASPELGGAGLLSERSAAGQPAVLADRVSLTLRPGERRVLRYAYGTVPRDGSLAGLTDLVDDGRAELSDLAAHWQSRLALAVAPQAPFLHREMAWHAAQLQQAAVYDSSFQAHSVVQGSAYMWLHGLDGAGRDFSLFSLPLTYLNPELAREQLKMIMAMTRLDGHDGTRISYAIQGVGQLEDAIIHHSPSDLDLFFLWALSEYVAATGDRAFLDEPVPYWPAGARLAEPVVDHARRAVDHLMHGIGTGEHGLIRLGTGDWWDEIDMQAQDRDLAAQVGESFPNTAMALWVLPKALALIEPEDPALAAEARAWVEDLRRAAAAQWTGRWYLRAWFGPDDVYGDAHLSPEAQIWALLSGLPDDAQRAGLLAEMDAALHADERVGAARPEDGLIWHAVTGLLTWAYADTDPQRAWRSLTHHTMAAYAEHNPDQWYGIWSGPDALGPDGGTWDSPVTPMIDLPIFNANQHALPLTALLRVAGVQPAPEGDGLRIGRRFSGHPLVVDTPLVQVRINEQGLQGEYRAQVAGSTALYLRIPEHPGRAWVDGQRIELPDEGEFLRLARSFEPGDRVTFLLLSD